MKSPSFKLPEGEEVDCIESTYEAAIDHLHECHNLNRKETAVLERLEEIKKAIELVDMKVRRGREERRETREVETRLRSLESRVLFYEMDAENHLFKFALICIGLIVSFNVLSTILK